MRKLAVIAVVLAVILGAVGSYKVYDEHDKLDRLHKLQDISRDLQRDAEHIADESNTRLGQALGMSTANMAQSQVNQYQEMIDLHESYQRTGRILIGVSLTLLTFGIVVLKRKKADTPIKSENESTAIAIEETNSEPPAVVNKGSETGVGSTESKNFVGWIFAAASLIIIFIMALIASQKSRTTQDMAPAPTETANATTPTPAPPSSEWQVDTETNPVTGMVTTTAFLKYKGKQNIYIRQRGKKLELYINTDQFLETLDNMESRLSPVQYKFDNGKVVRQSWSISSDNEALFYPGNPKEFLAQMRNAKILAFEYKPSDKIPDTITFDVTGLPDVFGKVSNGSAEKAPQKTSEER